VRPIACMVTDRIRIADPTLALLVAHVRIAAAAGVQLVQVRERDLDGRALFELARLAIDAVRGTAARILINDRLDVAIAAGAHGVHLRSTSFSPSRARAIVPPGFLIGQSVHSAADAAAARGADYLLFGNVFETGSKPGKPAIGLDALADVVRATPVPVLAIGGVTAERVPEVLAAGAAGYAGISMFGDTSHH
jgi:thiamine-phosphate diphosphorylase